MHIRFFPYLILIASLIMGISDAANAQTRSLPDDVTRGYVQHVRETMLSINGNQVLLAPNGTIRSTQNLIIMPTALPPEGAIAEFQLDANGQVQRMWLLTPEEASRQWPRTP